jgi:hypothetical protein
MTLSYVVWRQNGDHPDDGAARQDRSREGLVVRRYRHPGVLGAQTCPHCGVRMHEHGWIDCGEDGAVVCPGNIVIAGGRTDPGAAERFGKAVGNR